MAAVLEHITEDTQIDNAVHSDVAIGDAHPDRQVVIVLNSRGTEPTAMTVGSVSARRQKHEGFGFDFDASIWVADVPFGRTADITITGGDRYTAINVYRGVNVELYDAATDGDGGVDDSVAVTVDSGDASTVAGYHQGGAGGNKTTWTGVTERSDLPIDAGDANDTYSFADTLDDSTAGSLTVTAASISSQSASALVAATFRSANVAREIAVESTESGTSFACPQGTNLLVVVTADGAAQTGITYGGVSLTNVSAAVSGTASYAEVWVLKRPPVNSTLTLAGMTGEYYSVCLSGVDLKSAIEVAENSSISTALTSFETQLGSLSDEVFLLDAFRLDSQVTPSVGAGQTSIETGSTADPEGWGFSYKTVDTAAFDSMSWTFASADEPAHAVAAFQPQRLKSPAYQYEEVEGTLSRIDFNYEANDQGPYRSRWTKESNPTFASGIATFDGVDDYLDGPAFDFAGNGIFTFSLWARTTTIFGDDCYFSVHGSTNNTYAMLTNSNGKVRVVFRNSTSNIATSTSLVNDGDWHHIVGMGDGSTVKIFIDGVLEGTATITASAFTPTGSRIGSRNSFNPEYYPGDMADVRIFNRPLTNVEVSDLYARGENNLPVRRKWDSDPDVVLDMEHTAGVDRSGKGHHGTLEGAIELDEFGALYTSGTSDSDYMNLGDQDDHKGMSELTLEAWVIYDTSKANATVFGRWGTSGTRTFLLRINSDDIQFYISTTVQTGGTFHSTSIRDGEWHHLVATYDGVTMRMYLDGYELATTFTPLTPNLDLASAAVDTHLAGDPGSSGGYFPGRILRPRILRRALTNAEVKERWKLTNPNLILKADPPQRRQLHGCVGHWTAATEGRDLSGNGNHLDYSGDFKNNGGVWGSDSSGDSATITDDGSASGFDNQSFSVSFWMNARTSGQSNKSLVHYQDSAGSPLFFGFKIELNSDDIEFKWNDGSTFQFIRATSNLVSTDTWYLITCVFESGRQEIWMDDSIVASSTRTDTITYKSDPVIVGSSGYEGFLEDLTIYNRALTNGEVKALYQAGVPYYERPERRKLTGEAFHISASEGAVQLSDGAGVTYNGDVSIVDNEYEFDGTGDFITTDYQFKAPFTILTWLDTDQTSSIAVAIGTEENSRTRIGTTTLNRWMFEWSSASSMLINGATTGLHLLALTVDSSGNAEAFADGVSIGTSTGASTSTSTLKIGRTFTTTTQDWDGSIADVKVYERVLNPKEIAIEYNNGTPGYEPSVNHLEAPYQSLIRVCPTISGDESDITDKSANIITNNGLHSITTDYTDHGEAALDFPLAAGQEIDYEFSHDDAAFTAAYHFNFDRTNAGSMAGIGTWNNGWILGPAGSPTITNVRLYVNGVGDAETGLSISNEWHHLAGTFDPGVEIETFRNGTSVVSTTTSVPTVYTDNNLEIGNRGDGAVDFDGLIDDVIILPRVSHQAEINWISSERGIRRPLDPYNPVAWWCPSLDFPNAGTDYLMDLARTNHGTLTNMVAADDWVASTERGGTRWITCDSTDDEITVSDSSNLDLHGECTISFWVRNAGAGNFEFLERQGSTYFWQVFLDHNTVGLCFEGGEISGSRFRGRTTGLPNTGIFHVALIRTNSGVLIYVDGEPQSVSDDGNTTWDVEINDSADLLIGGGSGGHPGVDWDDVRIYDKALPIEAIKNLASKRGWTPEETTTITTAGDAAATTIFPFWAIIDNNNSFG